MPLTDGSTTRRHCRAMAGAMEKDDEQVRQDFHRRRVVGAVARRRRPGRRAGPLGLEPGRPRYRLAGPGVPLLYPEQRATPRGRAFVMRNFDFDRNGFVSPREARAANRAFAEVAGTRRDRFDWDHPGRVVVVEQPRGDWDHRAMRGYGFRQTARGATLTLQEDVLIKTDSAVLRPGAIDKLRPLAGYLRSEPGVRVAIDGYTDSRGTDAHNQA